MFPMTASGRWFNPPHAWTMLDWLQVGNLFLGIPAWAVVMYYQFNYCAFHSHFTDKHYSKGYHEAYTKEFVHKYKRWERHRIY